MGTLLLRLRTLLLAIVCAFCYPLSAQVIISEDGSLFWYEVVDTAFGGTATDFLELSEGNPASYRRMIYSLPAPPGPGDLTYVSVSHIYTHESYNPSLAGAIASIDYAEDIRLLDLPWDMAFIRSYPVIQQNDRIFRANQYVQVIADTDWTTRMITGLTAEDFVAIEGAPDHPDFSNQGGEMDFGFFRGSSRTATAPPIPPDEILIYNHGMDNFTVTLYPPAQGNQPPIARRDRYLYLEYFRTDPVPIRVLLNDGDPEDDTIRILNVQEPLHGTIVSFTDSVVHYILESPLFQGAESDVFHYSITDGELSSEQVVVNINFCICPIECIGHYLGAPITPNPIVENPEPIEVARSVDDTLDIALFRRFRDEILEPTETGAALVDLYYHHALEVMPLLLITRTDLGHKASNALILMQDPIRSLLDSNGSEIITQELIDSVNMVIDSLMLNVSDSLHTALEVALTELCPFEELVGLTAAEAAQSAVCDSMNTDTENIDNRELHNDILHQNYPNPFSTGTTSHSHESAETEIAYTLPRSTHVELAIYDMSGRKIKSLVDEYQHTGEQSMSWNGTDDHGCLVGAGIYLYQIRIHGYSQTKGMILVR